MSAKPPLTHREIGAGPAHLVPDGESEGPQVVVVVPKKHIVSTDHGEGWIIAWQEAFKMICKEKSLNLTDYRVLSYLQAMLDFDNWIRLSHGDIGEYIGVDRAHVSRSMKKLLTLGLVLAGPTVKKINTYRLSPVVGFKGSQAEAIKQRRAALRRIGGGTAPTEEDGVQSRAQMTDEIPD